LSIFCTISTFHHLYKTYALADSLAVFGFKLTVLLVDGLGQQPLAHQHISFLKLEDLSRDSSKAVIDKYARNQDKLRWALKSVLLQELLQTNSKVIYVDNDLFFFNSPQFLFDELDQYNVLLTPHFYPSSPKTNQTWLEANFRLGLFNAGFIGANKNAKDALDWWRDCCLYEIKKSYWRGLFDDQKYLDLLPILFVGVKILKHRGCNLAGWNDEVTLEKDQLIFVHFNNFTIKKFSKNHHPYHNLLTKYLRALSVYSSGYQKSDRGINKFAIQNAWYYIRWKLSRLL
jgi:hypothetical protein